MERVIPEDAVPVLDHGFVRLDGALADDLSVANSARVSFGRRKEDLDDSDRGLIKFLMRERHGTPFEHNALVAKDPGLVVGDVGRWRAQRSPPPDVVSGGGRGVRGCGRRSA